MLTDNENIFVKFKIKRLRETNHKAVMPMISTVYVVGRYTSACLTPFARPAINFGPLWLGNSTLRHHKWANDKV